MVDCGCVATAQQTTLWKSIIEVTALFVGVAGAIVALVTYRNNSKRERAKWAVQLFEKFYEADRYLKVREALDSRETTAEIHELVDSESAEFTDYLNFFEMVAFLAKSRQLSVSEILGLFQYYLGCLKRHTIVMVYVNAKSNGFEHLRDFFNRNEDSFKHS